MNKIYKKYKDTYKSYYEKNKESIKARKKIYYEENKDKIIKKNNYKGKTCIDCGKKVSNNSLRCKPCMYKTRIPWNKGKKFICSGQFKKGRRKLREENSNWKGGKKQNRGYIFIHLPTHPHAKKGYVQEHRLIVEKHLGRYLKKGEVVHHINEIKDDNRIENLMLFKTNAEHMKFHTKIRQFGMTTPIRRQIKDRWKIYNLEKI